MTVQPIVVSYSELDAFRQCPHKHFLAHREFWVPEKIGRALNTGRLWHEIMQEHYGALQAEATETERLTAVATLLLGVAQDDEDTAGLLAWMYDGYCEHWGTDDGGTWNWEILSIEDQRLIRLPGMTGRASRFWLRMRADLLVRERFGPAKKRKIWLVDHKSGQRLPTEKELDLDDQFGLYTWGLRSLGVPVFGSIYSAARTQRNKSESQPLEERFTRTRLYRTDRELETIAREAFVTARTAYRYGPWEGPRAPDTDRCRWRCPFTEPCLLGRKAGRKSEIEYLRSGGYERITELEALARRGYRKPPS